jgi:hypothetical protein
MDNINLWQVCDRFSLIENENDHSKKYEYKITDTNLPREISAYSNEEEFWEKKKLKFEEDETDKIKDKDKDSEI